MLTTTDPLHGASFPDSLWTTANIAEAMPGVLTPLGWTIWGPAAEHAARHSFRALGVLRPAEVATPDQIEERFVGIFYGRPALRLNFLSMIGDRMPGTSGSTIVAQFFGSVPPEVVSKAEPRYYPRVAIRLPRLWRKAPKVVQELRATTEEWWGKELANLPGAGQEDARRLFQIAVARFQHIVTQHNIALFTLVQPINEQLAAVAKAAGDLGPGLLAGHGGHDETQMVLDLWSCSRGQLDLAAFLVKYGYHGPREGEVSGKVWREDHTPVLEILEGYRALNDSADPVTAALARAQDRQMTEREVLAALPASRRVWARTVFKLSEKYVSLRGIGKTAFLQSLDVARAAARHLGANLADQGLLDDPEDVFFLTKDEIIGGRWAEASEQVAFRKERRSSYEAIELPVAWQGMPDPTNEPFAQDVVVLAGVAASPGVTEGRVRVVTDPGETAMEEGEILVARITDPSWASVLFLSGGLVTDIGGLLSHAAVVARELGVPCVVGTRVATKLLRTGDRCRLDGTTGRVEVLERAPSPQS